MKIKSQFYGISVNEINLSVALSNMLNNAGVNTLEDLAHTDLSRYRNFKGRRMAELQEALKPFLESDSRSTS